MEEPSLRGSWLVEEGKDFINANSLSLLLFPFQPPPGAA